MSAIAATLRSQPIARQIALLIVTSLMVTHIVVTSAVLVLYPRLDPMVAPAAAAVRLGVVAGLLNAASTEQQRAAILQTARAAIPELEAGVLPPRSRLLAPGSQAEQSSPHPGGRPDIFAIAPGRPDRPPRIAVRLPDGRALMAPLPPPGVPGPLTALIGSLVFLACVTVLLSIWTAGTLTAPLTKFADAAERFTLGRVGEPLPEQGPREIVRASRAFNAMRERVLRMVDDRTRMLAAVGHDLRTPLTRLRLRAEAVEPPPLRTQVLSDLDTMQSMVHVALSFLRDRATRSTQVRTDLPSLIQTVCDRFGDTGHDVRCSGGPAHLYVDCDPDQIARAVTNLVENGLKFARSATVDLRVTAGRNVDIDVQDDGPGIPDAEKHKVLEPFYRGDRARSLDGRAGLQQSFGLGLSICREIAEAHNGRLTLHDARPTGLVARLTLPLAASSAGGAAKPPHPAGGMSVV